MSAVSSLASAFGVSATADPVTMGIAALDLTTGEEDPVIKAFQYYPETISDSKSPEWSRKHVPGGSHPILSFINGGERTISFTAQFTHEMNPEPIGLLASLLTGSASFGLSGPTKHTLPAGEDDPRGGIPAAIAWLRSFTCPDYLENGTAVPPPACVVYMPNSGIIGSNGSVDYFVGVMTECNVTYQAFHRNGAPKIVEVSLSFVESTQDGLDWFFTGRSDLGFKELSDGYSLAMTKTGQLIGEDD